MSNTELQLELITPAACIELGKAQSNTIMVGFPGGNPDVGEMGVCLAGDGCHRCDPERQVILAGFIGFGVNQLTIADLAEKESFALVQVSPI